MKDQTPSNRRIFPGNVKLSGLVMKEGNVRIDDWEWYIDEESRLSPWFHIFREVKKTYTVREDESCCVFKVEDIHKHKYIVKHFFPDSLADHVMAFFSAKAKNIYRSAQLLHEASIPCVEYPGWAKNGTESMLLSLELPDTVSALEYWFRIAIHDSALRREFITRLCKLIMDFISASVKIREFSLEHILISTSGSRMYILNPQDAEYAPHGLSPEERLSFLKVFLELRGEISVENMAIALLEESFTDNAQEISDLLHDMIREYEKPLKEDILPDKANAVTGEGSCQFCQVIQKEEEDVLIRVRNTIWNAPIPVPTDENSSAEEVSKEEAITVWRDSFKAQLLRNHLSRIPLSWEQYGNGTNIIRYANSFDDILHCGFNQ